MSAISPLTSNAGSLYAATTMAGTSKALNQNDFLTLLVKQIQFQDPMNPKSNTDMAAQMAQFTSLQQASDSSASLNLLKASSLIDRQVLLQVDDKTQAAGVVSGLQMKNGMPQIIVGDRPYDLSQILAVMPAPVTMPTTPTTPTVPMTPTTTSTTTP